ncbi:carbohydrate ABC transporter permease [Planctomycetota bacterium]|nr:carbohydrate ABC transporter permease [Planctomycetota bacterium]
MSTIESTKELMRKPAKRSRKIFIQKFLNTGILNVFLTILSMLLILPFIWMLLTSVKPLSEVGTDSWIPSTWQWHNYLDVFDAIPYARYYCNSLLIATWITFLQVTTSALAAFSFSRLEWPGRDKVFMLYLSTMMLPGLVMMIPNYQIMIQLGLVDSIAGLILPGAFSAFGTFLLRQFMLSIPSSLDEAAEIDGASKWRLFWDIILPLSRPGVIALAIFTFVGNYHSFFWPLVMLKSQHKYTLPIGLLYFDSSAGQETNLLMAAVVMSVIPLVFVYVILQKQLVAGIQLGAVKG